MSNKNKGELAEIIAVFDACLKREILGRRFDKAYFGNLKFDLEAGKCVISKKTMNVVVDITQEEMSAMLEALKTEAKKETSGGVVHNENIQWIYDKFHGDSLKAGTANMMGTKLDAIYVQPNGRYIGVSYKSSLGANSVAINATKASVARYEIHKKDDGVSIPKELAKSKLLQALADNPQVELEFQEFGCGSGMEGIYKNILYRIDENLPEYLPQWVVKGFQGDVIDGKRQKLMLLQIAGEGVESARKYIKAGTFFLSGSKTLSDDFNEFDLLCEGNLGRDMNVTYSVVDDAYLDDKMSRLYFDGASEKKYGEWGHVLEIGGKEYIDLCIHIRAKPAKE